MPDLKTLIGTRFLVAFAIAIATFALLSPIVDWYIGAVPMTTTCGSNVFCDISKVFINTVIPIGALFLCVLAVIEVFTK